MGFAGIFGFFFFTNIYIMLSFLGLGDGTSVSAVVDLGGRRREVDRFPLVRRRYAVPRLPALAFPPM